MILELTPAASSIFWVIFELTPDVSPFFGRNGNLHPRKVRSLPAFAFVLQLRDGAVLVNGTFDASTFLRHVVFEKQKRLIA